jgi:hypothetical protein
MGVSTCEIHLRWHNVVLLGQFTSYNHKKPNKGYWQSPIAMSKQFISPLKSFQTIILYYICES